MLCFVPFGNFTLSKVRYTAAAWSLSDDELSNERHKSEQAATATTTTIEAENIQIGRKASWWRKATPILQWPGAKQSRHDELDGTDEHDGGGSILGWWHLSLCEYEC